MKIHLNFLKKKQPPAPKENSQESNSQTQPTQDKSKPDPKSTPSKENSQESKSQPQSADKSTPEPKPTSPQEKTTDVAQTPKQPFFKRLFHNKKDQSVSDEKIAKQTRQVLDGEVKKQKKKRRTAQYRKKMLNSLLIQAGFDIRHERLSKTVFYLSLIFTAFFSLVTLIIASVNGKNVSDILVFNLGLWTAIFAFIYLFIWMTIYVYLDVRIFNRTMQLEEVLPDFLQLASTNISAGMPIDRALWFAVRPNFGVLAKEIEQVAKETIAGEELNESLRRFTDRYDSVMLKRSINILLEGVAAGGEIADLLNKIALDIQETKILRKEMSANVATYAIFITFASIIMAPLLFALATQLLTIIITITSSLDLGSSSSSFFALNLSTDPSSVSDFKWFSVFMLTISAVMSASIVAVIRKGRVKEGLRNLPIFVLVSLSIYFASSAFLGIFMGGLL